MPGLRRERRSVTVTCTSPSGRPPRPQSHAAEGWLDERRRPASERRRQLGSEGGRYGMPDQVHAAVHAVQPPVREAELDRAPTEPSGEELLARDEAALRSGDRRDRPVPAALCFLPLRAPHLHYCVPDLGRAARASFSSTVVYGRVLAGRRRPGTGFPTVGMDNRAPGVRERSTARLCMWRVHEEIVGHRARRTPPPRTESSQTGALLCASGASVAGGRAGTVEACPQTATSSRRSARSGAGSPPRCPRAQGIRCGRWTSARWRSPRGTRSCGPRCSASWTSRRRAPRPARSLGT